MAKRPDRERPPAETGTNKPLRVPVSLTADHAKGHIRQCRWYVKAWPPQNHTDRNAPAIEDSYGTTTPRVGPQANLGIRDTKIWPLASKGTATPKTCACRKPDTCGTSRRRAALTSLLSCRRSAGALWPDPHDLSNLVVLELFCRRDPGRMARALTGRSRNIQRDRSRTVRVFRIDGLDLGFRLGVELAVAVMQPARKGKRSRKKRAVSRNLLLRL